MVDFSKQRKIRGKPGLVDASGLSLKSDANANEGNIEKAREAAGYGVIGWAQKLLDLYPGMNGIQVIKNADGSCGVKVFSTKQFEQPEDDACESF